MKKIILIATIIAILIVVVFSFFYAVMSPKTKTFQIQGMKVEVVKEGSGEAAKKGDTLKLNFIGTLADGKKFYSTYDTNMPFTFRLGAGEVIKGWELGIEGMKVGEKRKLTVPAELGYGSLEIGQIPKNSTTMFEVELLKIN